MLKIKQSDSEKKNKQAVIWIIGIDLLIFMALAIVIFTTWGKI